MSLAIYNTMARQKQPFEPIDEGRVRIYVCGMTVYDYCHLGHARVLVAFDVITRYLRARGYDVLYVRNITDVDDKILQRAAANGESMADLTGRFIELMHEDAARLGVLPPDLEPRATAHMDSIIDMVAALVAGGSAYVADNGDVYFAVASFAEYGRLSGKNPDELLAGARVDIGECKRDPRDFALWKAARPGEVAWDSPWGPGRPGWHIECSAMSRDSLGPHFDIHGGGPDLPFPHHENEIAQSEAANGCRFVNYWMHAGAVRIDGEKMSKSLGNFFTIRDILVDYQPELVRYALVSSHYRSPINYSLDSLQEAGRALRRLYTALRGIEAVEPEPLAALDANDPFVRRFRQAMDDDFNTPVALAVLFDLARDLNTAREGGDAGRVSGLAALLKSLAEPLGLLQADPDSYLQAGSSGQLSAAEIERAIERRLQAKRDREYAAADAIREELKQAGVLLEDTRQGTIWKRETV